MLRPENKNKHPPVRVIVFFWGGTRNGCSNESQLWQIWQFHPWLTSVVVSFNVFSFFFCNKHPSVFGSPPIQTLPKKETRLLTVPSHCTVYPAKDEALWKTHPFLRNNHPTKKMSVKMNGVWLLAASQLSKWGRLLRIAASRILVHQRYPLWT